MMRAHGTATAIACLAPVAAWAGDAVPLVDAGAPSAANDPDSVIFGVLAVGAVLVLLGLLFLIRKFLAVVVNLFMILLGVALVLIAAFGHPLGIWDLIVNRGG